MVAEKAYTKGAEPIVNRVQAGRKSFSSSGTPPPVPPRLPGSTSPAPPPYQSSPLSSGQSTPNRPPVPPKPANLTLDTSRVDAHTNSGPSMLGGDLKQTPTTATPSSASSAKKRPFLNRILLAGEVVLTSLEATAQDLITNGTAAASKTAGHKFGPEAGHATALLGGSVRNVAVVYIDVRGVGRKALLTGTAKGFVKARLRSGEEVQLQAGGVQGPGGIAVEAGEAEKMAGGGTVVVGMPQVGTQAGMEAMHSSQPTPGGQRRVTDVDHETLAMLDRMNK